MAEAGVARSMPGLRFVSGNGEEDAEIKLVSGVGVAAWAFLAVIGYGIHKAPALGRTSKKVLLGLFLPFFVVVPFLILRWRGPCKALMGHFVLSFLGVVGFFRWLELMCGTGPRGFDDSFGHFFLYFVSPAEVLFDEEGKLMQAPPGQLRDVIAGFIGYCVLSTLALTLGRATGFSPFLETGADPFLMPHFGVPWSLPAVYLQAVFVYSMLGQAMTLHRAPLAIMRIATRQPMRSPLWMSTSVRDFWGRRWNLLVHHLMKRTFFSPFADRGDKLGRHAGGVFAFLMSGLFHEHMWAAVNWPYMDNYVPGMTVAFFLVQFMLVAAEAALEKTTVGLWASTWPRWVKTLATTLVVLPAGPMFLHGIRGMAMDCAEWGHTVELVRETSNLENSRQTSPPLDWVLMAVFLGLLAAHNRWKALRQKRQRVLMPPPVIACSTA